MELSKRYLFYFCLTFQCVKCNLFCFVYLFPKFVLMRGVSEKLFVDEFSGGQVPLAKHLLFENIASCVCVCVCVCVKSKVVNLFNLFLTFCLLWVSLKRYFVEALEK